MVSCKLPESGIEIPGLRAIIEIIVQVIDPEKILLLSSSHTCRITEHIFNHEPKREYLGNEYDLLLLLSGIEKTDLIKQEILLQNRLAGHANLILRLKTIHEFNEDIKAGYIFENFILLNAMIWYDKGHIPFADPRSGSSAI